MNDGSFSTLIQYMTIWKRSRYGISSPRKIAFKLKRSLEVFLKNKFGFLKLVFVYFIVELICNGGILLLQWTLDPTEPRDDPKMIIVQLTASVPIKLIHSLLSYCVLYVCMSMLKRNGYYIDVNDVKNAMQSLNFKVFVKILFANQILSSPILKAFALLSTDIAYSVSYFIAGFFLNWLFSMVPFLIIEDGNISILQCFLWSASTAIDAQYSPCIFASTLITLMLSPFVIFTPILIILQLLNFFEAFGYNSPSEVQLTAV